MRALEDRQPTWVPGAYRMLGVEPLAATQLQLYRYAEDLKLLADRHAELEQKLERTQLAYQRAYEHGLLLERLLMCVSEINLVTDEVGNVVEISPRASELLGVTMAERMHISVLFDPADRVKFVKLFAGFGNPHSAEAGKRLDLVLRVRDAAQRTHCLVPWVMSLQQAQGVRYFWSLRDPGCL